MQLSSHLIFTPNLSCSRPGVELVLPLPGLHVLHAPQVEAWVLQALLLVHPLDGLVLVLNGLCSVDKFGPGQALTQLWYIAKNSECAVLGGQNAGLKSDKTWWINDHYHVSNFGVKKYNICLHFCLKS